MVFWRVESIIPLLGGELAHPIPYSLEAMRKKRIFRHNSIAQ